MKKALKALTAVGTAALAVIGGICVYRKFFAKDEELDEVFDEDVLDEAEDDVIVFDSEEEIFEEDETAAPTTDEVVAVEAGCPEEAAKAAGIEE